MLHNFVCNHNNKRIWSLGGRSKQFGIGVIVASKYVSDKIPPEYTFTYYNENNVEDSPDNIVVTSDYIKYTSDNFSNTCRYGALGYNVWINYDEYPVLFCIHSKITVFFQGIFTILNAFNIDYKELILTCPLRIYYLDGIRNQQYYEINGYSLPFINNLAECENPETSFRLW